MRSNKKFKISIACDGGAASGKTTGAKLIAKKYNLNFLSSGKLYRYASYMLLKNNPKNKIPFLKKTFKRLNIKKLNKINLNTSRISEHTSLIAKERKIRLILKNYQQKFAKLNSRPIIEGRDISTVILPKADIKFFFKCSLEIASKRRFKEFRKKKYKITLKEVKKSIKTRNYRDKNRVNSPLIQPKDAVIVQTDKINISGMINKMSEVIERKIKKKYGS